MHGRLAPYDGESERTEDISLRGEVMCQLNAERAGECGVVRFATQFLSK